MSFAPPPARSVEVLSDVRAALGRLALTTVALTMSAAPALAACPAPYNVPAVVACTASASVITCRLDSTISNNVQPIYYSETYTSGTRYFRAFGTDDNGDKFCDEIEVQTAQITGLNVVGSDNADAIYLNYAGNPTAQMVITVDADSGSDTVDGSNSTTSVDTLNGDGGNDTIDGKAGDDEVNGGDGNDDLTGGDGDDVLNGGGGTDTLRGNAGDDIMDGGADADTMYGQDGADFMEGGTGNDYLKGGDGNDEMYGDDGVDNVCGEAGGGDTLYGGAGDDALNTGSLSEYAYGEGDFDTCSANGTAYAVLCEGPQSSCSW